MSNQQHTPGPFGFFKAEPFGFFKAEPFGWTDCAETDEGAQPLFDQAAIDAVTGQRDELPAVLVEAREALQFTSDSPGGVPSETIWMIHRPETLFDFMDSAITSVKGTPK